MIMIWHFEKNFCKKFKEKKGNWNFFTNNIGRKRGEENRKYKKY